jgi:hypothetical protein
MRHVQSLPIAVAAFIIAVFAAILAGYSVWEDDHVRKEMAVQTQMQSYLADYAALRASYDNAGFSASSYFDGDPRADRWARLLSGYPGPIADFGLLDGYARTSWGKRKLAEARASTPWKRYPKCAEPDISRQPPAVPKGAAVN